jgi:oligopeptide transport system substrate-binding protein
MRFLLPALLSLLMFLSGCGEDLTTAEQAAGEGVLLMNLGGKPKALDPHVTTGIIESKIHSALFEGLVTPGPKLEPLPGVAQNWEVSEDGLTWTFALRPEARWSNGEALTARDFVFAYRRILTPSLGAEYASMLDVIENAFAYRSGELNDFARVGVKALDAHTLEITLEQPAPYFLTMLFHHAFYPVPEKVIRASGEPFMVTNKWAGNRTHVGNGPFRLEQYRPGEEVATVANEHYWDPEAVKLEGIRFSFIEDPTVEERNFRDGELHITSTIPTARIASYREDDPAMLSEHPSMSIYYYGFNVSRPPLDDVRVRHALNLAIDRALIVERIKRGGQEPAYRLIPTAMPGYRSEARVVSPNLRANIRQARELLAEAGYPDGEGFPELTLLFNDKESHRDIAEAIQAMWRDNLGIDSIELLNKNWPAYLQDRREGQFDIMRAGWLADYVDPSTFLEIWKSDSGLNHTRWGSAYFDRFLAQALREPEPDRRMLFYNNAEQVLVREMPFIPLYFDKHIYLRDPAVNNWHLNVLDIRSYKGVSLSAPTRE